MGCLQEPPKQMAVDSVDQKELMKQMVINWARMKADCLALTTVLQMVGSWAQMLVELTSLAVDSVDQMELMKQKGSQMGCLEELPKWMDVDSVDQKEPMK
jgi:hypothetical protein